MITSKEIDKYFETIEKGVSKSYAIATKARKLGYDPEDFVDIRLAKNMAERVEGLMSSVAPELVGTDFTARIMELEKEYSPLDWRVALRIGEEVAKEKFCKFKDKRFAMEIGIRAGFTYHTGGIVSAPLEGLVELRIKKTKNGKEYLAPVYAGPIRGAGGTAASFSLVMTDYIRVVMGYEKYDPDENEINRFKTEIEDYNGRVTNLQYFPSRDEIDFMVRHLPVEIDGEPTEKFDVSNYKDINRIQTNRIRGGLCLVLAEGISQKAPKVWKRLKAWGKELNLDWNFLEEFLALQKKIKAKDQKPGKKNKLSPNFTFIADLVAGRPVLTHPMAVGGFRLRYGRSRVSGFSAASINPATMLMLNKFIATGTQLKIERPGKAASMTPCDTIDGPIIKTDDGSVVKLYNHIDAKNYVTKVKEILFLGDMLVNYGDFSENGHLLIPCGYNQEWWMRDFEKAIADKNEKINRQQISEFTKVSKNKIKELFNDPFTTRISAKAAINISKYYDIPLHPDYTYFWKHIEPEEIIKLVDWIKTGKIYKDGDEITKIVIKSMKDKKLLLEKIGLVHNFVNHEYIVIDKDNSLALLHTLGINNSENQIPSVKLDENLDSVENINKLSPIKIIDKAGTYIGARMGRPEKAKMRKLTGSPHSLFPIGEEGGRLRSFQAALEAGKVTADLPMYKCEKCNTETVYPICEKCGRETKQLFLCAHCGLIEEETCEHGKAATFRSQEVDIKYYFQSALKKMGEKVYPDLIKGVRTTVNSDHIPENIMKGIIRAKHEIHVNKDGTIRFDMSELPITHFKPEEIFVSLEKLNELGYTHDIYNNPITNTKQIIEIKPQDVILPIAPDALDEQSDKILVRTTKFVDELLQKMYGQKPFYNVKTKEDLIGHLVIGLAPHISAGTVGRIIGFTKTQGLFAHPLFHAAMRRDCDGDEACVILLMEGFLNFSRQYLPATRGAKTMDAPLVLTSQLNPAEVDDMAHGLDIVWKYPLELYNAANEMKYPWDIKINQICHTLGTEKQFEEMGFTHDVSNINIGIGCSAYKSLPSMEEKLKGQMLIAEKIRAVDESDVATLIINKHFLRDTKGNLRKFSTQRFRCVKCNEKYRRPPLRGNCTCGGRIIFTVSYGSVVKYFEPTLSLAKKYHVSEYLNQTLALLQLRIEGVFGREKEKQEGLGKWFG
jgi:DNA polymerase II large subunit